MGMNKKDIWSISQDIQAGLIVYVYKQTHEIKSLLNPDGIYMDIMDDEDLEELNLNWTDYVKISQMESFEAFRIMEQFAKLVEEVELKNMLEITLQMKSPFANFKRQIESSSYREMWFKFKDKKYEEYVKNILEEEKIEIKIST